MIRSAKTEDAEAVSLVHVRSWQSAYRGLIGDEVLNGLDATLERRNAYWERLLADDDVGHVHLVAEQEGQVVAFLSAGPARDDDLGGRPAEIPVIYALEEVWGQGLGAGLMNEAYRRLSALGYTQVALWVLDTNERARAFYEKGGFLADGSTKVDEINGAEISEVRYVRPL